MQVILGLVVGYTIDKVSSRSAVFLTKLQWTLPSSKINFYISSVVLLLSGVGIYYGLQMVGLDPEFSVPLAMEYCQERSWVHLDTTPFYSLMRSTGALLGMGVVASLAGDKIVKIEGQWRNRRVGVKFLGTASSLIVIAFIHSYIPSFGVGDGAVILFYSVALFKTALISCVTFSVCVFVGSFLAIC